MWLQWRSGCLIADTLFLSTSDSSETPELPNYDIEGGANFHPLANELTNQQVQELHTLWKEFPYATGPKLGRAKQVVHRIITGNATPVRMVPYRVPRIWEEPFHAELKKLQEAKLIVRLHPPGLPMFAVPKKTTGQIRLVNDSQTKQCYQPWSVLPASRGRDISQDGPSEVLQCGQRILPDSHRSWRLWENNGCDTLWQIHVQCNAFRPS